MALDFPSSPTNGQVYGNYYYDATVGAWNSFSSTVNPIPSTLKNLSVNTDNVGLVPLTVSGASGQTVNLQNWKNSAGTVVASVNNAGVISADTLNLVNDLTVTNGGTGAGTFTTGAYLKGNGTSAIQAQTGIPFSDVTVQTIGAAADLNTYVTQGIYHQGANVNAAGGTNYPVPYAGLLEVFQIGTDGSGFTYQRYTVYQSQFAIYARSKYTTTWTTWQQIPVGTVTVAEGGTGATTASSALTNLGAAPLAGAAFTGAISGTSASFSGSVSGTQVVGTTPNDSGSTGGVGIKAPAGGTQTSAYLQFVNNAYSAQWAAIEATSAGVMNLSASYIRKPSQPSFLAYRPAGNNWGQSTGVLPFYSTRHNTGGHYNTSNYRFTAPIAGTYVFTLHFNVYSASGVIVHAVFGVNGAAAFAGNRFNTAGGDQDATASLTIYLNAGDYVDPRCYLSSSMSCSSGEYWSHFSGFLLG